MGKVRKRNQLLKRKRAAKKNKLRKEAKLLPTPDAAIEKNPPPKSFVIRRGNAGKAVKQLVHDIRGVLKPFTAEHLKEKKTNTVKDFVQVSSVLGVNNMVVLSNSQRGGVYFRLCKLPQGPTLSFSVDSFALMRDVFSAQEKPRTISGPESLLPPLVVLNGFPKEDSGNSAQDTMRLASVMIRGLFPPIQVEDIKLSDCKRVVLFEYIPPNNETDTEENASSTRKRKAGDLGHIEIRHYYISVVPHGVSRSIKKLKSLPQLGKYEDIADYVLNGGNTSGVDSELEDVRENRIVDLLGVKGTKAEGQNAIRLQELGPRLTLSLLQAQDGLFQGDTIFEATSQQHVAESQKKANLAKIKAKKKRYAVDQADAGSLRHNDAPSKKKKKQHSVDDEPVRKRSRSDHSNEKPHETTKKAVKKPRKR